MISARTGFKSATEFAESQPYSPPHELAEALGPAVRGTAIEAALIAEAVERDDLANYVRAGLVRELAHRLSEGWGSVSAFSKIRAVVAVCTPLRLVTGLELEPDLRRMGENVRSATVDPDWTPTSGDHSPVDLILLGTSFEARG